MVAVRNGLESGIQYGLIVKLSDCARIRKDISTASEMMTLTVSSPHADTLPLLSTFWVLVF